MTKDIKTTPSPFGGDHSGAARIDVPDFTFLDTEGAPPWFANVQVEYVPREEVLDVKSVGEYMDGWRGENGTPDDVVKKICEELAEAVEPMALNVSVAFRNRDGITLNLQSKYLHPDAKQPQQRILHG
jgi:7-cyano-7-deazaguanine reductase